MKISIKLLLAISIAAILLAVTFYLWNVHAKGMRQWDLSEAAEDGDLSRVQELFAKGADINAIPERANGAVSRMPALSAAVHGRHEEIVRFLLDHGANTEVRVEDTPLLIAASQGDYDIAKLLLERGANPNVSGEGTPLRNAEGRGDTKMAQLLRSYGAKEQVMIDGQVPYPP